MSANAGSVPRRPHGAAQPRPRLWARRSLACWPAKVSEKASVPSLDTTHEVEPVPRRGRQGGLQRRLRGEADGGGGEPGVQVRVVRRVQRQVGGRHPAPVAMLGVEHGRVHLQGRPPRQAVVDHPRHLAQVLLVHALLLHDRRHRDRLVGRLPEGGGPAGRGPRRRPGCRTWRSCRRAASGPTPPARRDRCPCRPGRRCCRSRAARYGDRTVPEVTRDEEVRAVVARDLGPPASPPRPWCSPAARPREDVGPRRQTGPHVGEATRCDAAGSCRAAPWASRAGSR